MTYKQIIKQSNKQKFALLAGIFSLFFILSVVYSCRKQQDDFPSSEKNIKQAALHVGEIMKGFTNGIVKRSYSGSPHLFMNNLIADVLPEYPNKERIDKEVLGKLHAAGILGLNKKISARIKIHKTLFDELGQPPTMVDAVDAMQDVVEVVQDYLSSNAYAHIETLMNEIESEAIIFESIHSDADLTAGNLTDFKGIISTALTNTENNINSDFSISSTEKISVLNNLLLMKNLLATTDFDNSVYTFVNNGGDNVVSLIANNMLTRGFFKKLFKAVLYGVIVVATGIAGYAIGTAIGGFAGGIAGAALGVGYALTWAGEWLQLDEDPDGAALKNKNSTDNINFSYANSYLQ